MMSKLSRTASSYFSQLFLFWVVLLSKVTLVSTYRSTYHSQIVINRTDFESIGGFAVESSGKLYISDKIACQILITDPNLNDDTTQSFAGDIAGSCEFSGAVGASSSIANSIGIPGASTFDRSGNFYFSSHITGDTDRYVIKIPKNSLMMSVMYISPDEIDAMSADIQSEIYFSFTPIDILFEK